MQSGREPPLHNIHLRQANANELIAQMAMVVLSGSKALMLFQSNQADFKEHKVVCMCVHSARTGRRRVARALQKSLHAKTRAHSSTSLSPQRMFCYHVVCGFFAINYMRVSTFYHVLSSLAQVNDIKTAVKNIKAVSETIRTGDIQV